MTLTFIDFQKTYQVVRRKFKAAIGNLLQVSFIPLLKELLELCITVYVTDLTALTSRDNAGS